METMKEQLSRILTTRFRTLCIIAAVIFTILLSLNYNIGVIQTPPWLVYLGTVHYPVDYFYYLSLFTEGQTRWITSIDIYTHDFRQPMLLGFTNVLAGRILSLLGFQPITAYQIALALFTFIVFLLVIRYLETLYPTHKSGRLIAFFLFFVANTFPGSGSFYANAAEPLVRFARVPHKMLGLIFMILPMYIMLKLQDNKPLLNNKFISYILIAVSGIVAANINPVQWLLVSFVLFGGFMWQTLMNYSPGRARPGLLITKNILSPCIFFLAGFPMAVYLVKLFTIPPFSQSTAWESLQQVSLTPLGFIQSFGPVVLLGFLGIPVFLKKMTLPRVFMILYFILSILFFISPVSTITHSTNTRFLSAITILSASILATDFLIHIPIANRKKQFLIIWAIVIALGLYLIPSFVSQYKRNANLALNNSYIYISKEAYQAFMETKKRTDMSDVILVTWPYEGSFPALTGRRGYMGNPDQTINPDYKGGQAYDFFDARVSDDAMHTFLTENGITYVLSFTVNTKIVKPFVVPVYQNAALTLYKVLP